MENNHQREERDSETTTHTPPVLLLAEDEPDDIRLMRLVVEKCAPDIELFAVSDGKEAVDYLKGAGEYSNRFNFPLPSVIVTDIKMPRFDGFQLLNWVKTSPTFKDLPVIVFSSSNLEADRARASQLGADAYHVKNGLPELSDLVKQLEFKFH